MGTNGSVNSDVPHPLELEDTLPRLTEAAQMVTLEFAVPPAEIVEVCCWSKAYWGDYAAAVAEQPKWKGNCVKLLPGGYIYEVTAAWNDAENAYNGNCHYAFYAVGAE